MSGERFLVDTGAEISVLAVKSRFRNSPTDFKLYAANGTTIRTYGEKPMNLDFGLRRKFSWNFIIADTQRSILGADFLKIHHIIVDLKRGKLIDGVTKLTVQAISTYCDSDPIYVINQDHPYLDILAKYPEIQRPMSMNKPPPHNVCHHLETTGKPIFVRPRPLPPDKYIEAKKEFERLMEMGICRPSDSPWANPLHVVKKKNGQLRICGDYRRLNAITVPDRYPIPRVQDFTFRLHGMKVFSKIDIKKAYYWIPMRKEDAQKTAITTPFGLYEFTSMTFGLRNAAQTFQRFMHQVLQGTDEFAFNFVDDLLVYSPCKKSHEQHLLQVFKRLSEYGLCINTDKCEFGKSTLDFLGYEVSEAGIRPPEDKTTAISSYPKPKTIEELRRFLGMINFYRDCLSKQADRQQELNKLLHNSKKKDRTPIPWTPATEEAFVQCRDSIKEAATLSHPIPGAPLQIMADASDISMGAVLQQREGTTCKPIAFFSKSLSATEKRYSVYDRELLAIYTAVKHFRKYIEGLDVVVYTDHKPLTFALTKPPSSNDTPRRERQLQFISQFCKTIKYVSGRENVVADTLSRIEEIDLTSTIDYHRVGEEQKSDMELKMLKNNNKLKFAEINLPGMKMPITCEMSNKNPRPYLPASCRKAAHTALHEMSHPGVRNTRKQISSKYFWPGMNKDIAEWTRSCIQCQRSKIQRHTVTPLGQFQEAGRFDHVHIDIVGPLLPSEGYQYIVTMIDRTTRWPEAVPVRDITADTVARAVYEHWICRFGCPIRITTDQGRQFESALFLAFTKRIGVSRLRTTAYHPQSNGLVERWHRTMKAALMARGSQTNWTRELHTVLLGLRVALHRDSNLSPALLTYGSTPRVPGDFFITPKVSQDVHSFVNDLTKTMASLKPPEQKTTQTRTLFIPQQLAACSYVFVRVDGVKKPLTPPYEGPFEVLEKHEKFFKVKLPKRTAVISLDRLKPAYIQNDDHSAPDNVADTKNTPYVTRSGRQVRQTVRFA